jgi:adenylate cyclase
MSSRRFDAVSSSKSVTPVALREGRARLEGRLFRWGYSPAETPLLEYGRTSPDALAASGFNPRDVETAERWRRSPHYRMLQTGESFWRRRLNGATENEFSVLPEWRAEGMTDYVAIITRFAAEGVIGEMDGVYSSWATRDPGGFTDNQIVTLKRIVPLNQYRSRA